MDENRNTKKDIVFYSDDIYTFGETDKMCYLKANGEVYYLSCHPYEPCMYIKSGAGISAVIHNAFDPFVAAGAFSRGGSVASITGKVYNPKEFCEMLVFAAQNFYDTDISYVEGAAAVKKMKDIGAVCPEKAVDIKELGVKSISSSFSHSKKLTERVMYTEEGKVYVRIKK